MWGFWEVDSYHKISLLKVICWLKTKYTDILGWAQRPLGAQTHTNSTSGPRLEGPQDHTHRHTNALCEYANMYFWTKCWAQISNPHLSVWQQSHSPTSVVLLPYFPYHWALSIPESLPFKDNEVSEPVRTMMTVVYLHMTRPRGYLCVWWEVVAPWGSILGSPGGLLKLPKA